MTTTSFGSFYNLTGTLNPATVIADYMSGGDTDWREAMEEAGAVDATEADFREAINAILPEGVWLTGDELIGYIDAEIDAEQVREAIEDIDLGAIIARHDIGIRADSTVAEREPQTVTLVSACVGDIVPGHALTDPDCPQIPGLTDRDDVQAFFAANGYVPDGENELMYLVADGKDIPAGYPSLTIAL